eukprot:TRINITY_DN27732_c0_g2_i1.p1 TRINITY_DN27732_c0_g2~~TRINITY_DN27732_c0_g2_i1.p1  ORF type:complete len:870 (+),score=176.97 TRINITY_DN27732_c0_g2_i1:76-2685(+)
MASTQNPHDKGATTAQASSKGAFRRKASAVCQPIAKHRAFQSMMAVALLLALFLPYVWAIADIQDDPGLFVLDLLMCIIFFLFVAEAIVRSIAEKSYPLSYFFWMDVIGTLSMLFEISWIAGADSNADTVFMRTARTAKLGARAGRLVKLSSLMQLIRGEQDQQSGSRAKRLARKLTQLLSTRISILVLGLMMVIPIFSMGVYPTADFSMTVYADQLERELASGGRDSAGFAAKLEEMREFYKTMPYQPYALHGFDGNTAMEVLAGPPGEPNRIASVFKQMVTKCTTSRSGCNGQSKAMVIFDFTEPERQANINEALLVLFIIAVMAIMTCDMSRVIDTVVIQPLETMMTSVRNHAKMFLDKFDSMQGDSDSEGENDVKDEAVLMQMLFERLATMLDIQLQTNVCTEEELRDLDQAEMGVVTELMGMKGIKSNAAHKSDSPPVGAPAPPSNECAGDAALFAPAPSVKITPGQNLFGGDAPVSTVETPVSASLPPLAVPKLPVDEGILNSWEFDVLSLNPQERARCARYILFESEVGRVTGKHYTDPDTFAKFFEMAMGGYNDLPYHNAPHALDVTHTVFRLIVETHATDWVKGVEIYALVMAAISHDLGHQGMTNPFLVETKHEWALSYNDASPLENMHCASLFKLLGNEEINVFKRLPVEQFRQARKVCIACILHTDNANHFAMVKDIKGVYELYKEVCDEQAVLEMRRQEKNGVTLHQGYSEQVLQQNSMLFLELFLHLADVSNPLKPFEICKAWAWRVLDEFFAQGDKEKELGIPVGMLNDRDKINRPGSQHGFINFLVAPLVFSTVEVFPSLHQLSSQMASNLQEWMNTWAQDAQPTEEALAKKEADVKKVREKAEQLRKRVVKL